MHLGRGRSPKQNQGGIAGGEISVGMEKTTGV